MNRAAQRRLILSARTTTDHALVWLLDRVVRASARPYLRTLLGRWPTRDELRDFRAEHAAGGHLPRSLHALSTMGSARQALTAAALESWLPHAVEGAADALALITRPRLAFMHIEKTAGSSVQEFLLPHYHPAQIVPQPPDGETANAVLLRDPTARRRALIYGHYDLPFLRAWDPARLVFTILRDPRARILSLYYYWRSARPAADGRPPPAVLAAAALPLAAFLASDAAEIRNQIDNFYARRLTAWSVQAGQDPLTLNPEAALRNALAALQSLCFVGIAERMTDSLTLLAARLNMIPPLAAPWINGADRNVQTLPRDFRPVAREPITPQIDRELARLTRIDDILYQAALRRFEAEYAQFDATRHAAEPARPSFNRAS